MYLRNVISLLYVVSSLCPKLAYAEDTIRIIIERPEERKRTNRSLGEWLKLTGKATTEDFRWFFMANPAEKTFRPELHLGYGQETGATGFDLGDPSVDDGSVIADQGSQATTAKAELWLTNIVAASTGLRALNIDLGLEAFGRRSSAMHYALLMNSEMARSQEYTRGGMMLRLFGKHIQDSALAIKAGQYEIRSNLLESSNQSKSRLIGNYGGVTLCLYLVKFLGLDSEYVVFQETNSSGDKTPMSGNRLSYGTFLEVSLFRLEYGLFSENWEQKEANSLQEKGSYLKATLLL